MKMTPAPPMDGSAEKFLTWLEMHYRNCFADEMFSRMNATTDRAMHEALSTHIARAAKSPISKAFVTVLLENVARAHAAELANSAAGNSRMH